MTIAFLFLYIIFILNIISFIYLANKKINLSLSNNSCSTEIVLLFPVYFEQEIIHEVLLSLSKIEHLNVKFVFVTSQKEEILVKMESKISSKQILQNEIASKNKAQYFVVEKEGNETSKSLQIIEGINFLKKINIHDKSFVGILDFDSHITENILAELTECNRKNDIVQVIPLPIKHVQKNARNITNYSLANLIAQTFRNISIEKRFFYLKSLNINLPFYVTGACLFIKKDVIDQLCFHPANDDLFLSKQIDANGYRVGVLNSTIHVEPCPDVFSNIFQTRNIFKGILVSLRDNIKPDRLSMSYFIFWILQIIDVSTVPLLLVFLFFKAPIMVIGVILLHVLKVPMIIFWLNKNHHLGINGSKMTLTMFYFLLRPFVRLIGFWSIFYNLTNRKISKTPRL